MIGSAAVPPPEGLLLFFWGVGAADDGEDDPVADRSSAEEYIPLRTFFGAEDWPVEELAVVEVDWSTGGLVPTMVEAWARRVVEPWVPPDMVVPRALSLLSLFWDTPPPLPRVTLVRSVDDRSSHARSRPWAATPPQQLTISRRRDLLNSSAVDSIVV